MEKNSKIEKSPSNVLVSTEEEEQYNSLIEHLKQYLPEIERTIINLNTILDIISGKKKVSLEELIEHKKILYDILERYKPIFDKFKDDDADDDK